LKITPSINEYEGINPHLNDMLQEEGMLWKEFHDTHITDIRRLLNQQLVPTGYEARLVSGLQLTTLDLDTLNYDPSHPIQPDVLVRQYAKGKAPLPPTDAANTQADASVKEYSIPDALGLSEQDYLNALAIVKVGSHSDELPLAWIELLSPSNKPGGAHHDKYESKCLGLLEKGIPLVQIDYLNQTSAVFPVLPHYPQDPGSKPFYLSVSDPRPTQDYPQGKVRILQFGIEESVPTTLIPFRDGDGVRFNFDSAYDETVKTAYAWHVDYEQAPLNWDSYSNTDQRAIAARMYTVLDADRRGLITAKQENPLPLACSLEEGPSRLSTLLNNPGPANVPLDR